MGREEEMGSTIGWIWGHEDGRKTNLIYQPYLSEVSKFQNISHVSQYLGAKSKYLCGLFRSSNAQVPEQTNIWC